MAPRSTAPEPQPANLSVEQKTARLRRRIADLETFDPQSVQEGSAPAVTALETAIEETLSAVFGHATVEYNRYLSAAKLDDRPKTVKLGPRFGPTASEVVDQIATGQYLTTRKQQSRALLGQAVRGLEEEMGDRVEGEQGKMVDQEFSEQGRRDRFAQWEKLGSTGSKAICRPIPIAALAAELCKSWRGNGCG
jgi:hypothetical protein